MSKSAALFLPGMLFGMGLGVAGMTNPSKVIGFLDLAGDWDPSLAFVMIGAIGSFAILNLLVHRRSRPLLGGSFPGVRSTAQSVDGSLLAGAAIFGIGWGIGGICPGPAVANLSRDPPPGGVRARRPRSAIPLEGGFRVSSFL